ncbi:hypothetical protein Tco_1501958 [Tanacetum coccineum]
MHHNRPQSHRVHRGVLTQEHCRVSPSEFGKIHLAYRPTHTSYSFESTGLGLMRSWRNSSINLGSNTTNPRNDGIQLTIQGYSRSLLLTLARKPRGYRHGANRYGDLTTGDAPGIRSMRNSISRTRVDARLQNFKIQFLKEVAKFVRDFKSLAKEADESLAKHKALELKIEHLLRAVFSQDSMSIVQRVDNTAKTRRPQPRSNTKNDRVPSASKNSCIKNKEVEVEEHHRK